MKGSPLASLASSLLSGNDMKAFKQTQMPDMPTGTTSSGSDSVAASPLSAQQQGQGQQQDVAPPPAPDQGSGDTADTSRMVYSAPRGPDQNQIIRDQTAIDQQTTSNADPNNQYADPYSNPGDSGGGGDVISSSDTSSSSGYAAGGVVKAIPDRSGRSKPKKKVKKYADGGPVSDDDTPDPATMGMVSKATGYDSDKIDPSLVATKGEVDSAYKNPDSKYGKTPREQAQFGHAAKDAYKATGGMKMDTDKFMDTTRPSENVQYAGDSAPWWTKTQDAARHFQGGMREGMNQLGVPVFGTRAKGTAEGSKMSKDAGLDDVPGYAAGGTVRPSLPAQAAPRAAQAIGASRPSMPAQAAPRPMGIPTQATQRPSMPAQAAPMPSQAKVPGYAGGGVVAPSVAQIGARGSAGGGTNNAGSAKGLSAYYWGGGGHGASGFPGGGGGIKGGGIVGSDPSAQDHEMRMQSLKNQSAETIAGWGAQAAMYGADSSAAAQVDAARIHEDGQNLRQMQQQSFDKWDRGGAGYAQDNARAMAQDSNTASLQRQQLSNDGAENTQMLRNSGKTSDAGGDASASGTQMASIGTEPHTGDAGGPSIADDQMHRRTLAGGGGGDTLADGGGGPTLADGGGAAPMAEAASGGPIPAIQKFADGGEVESPDAPAPQQPNAPAPDTQQGDERNGPPQFLDKAKMYAQEGLYEGHRRLMQGPIPTEDPEVRKQKVMSHLSRNNADPFLGASLEAIRLQNEKDGNNQPYWANVDQAMTMVGDATQKTKFSPEHHDEHPLYSTVQALAQKYMGNTAHATVALDNGDPEKAAAFANSASDYVAGQNLVRFKPNGDQGFTATVVDKKSGEPIMEKNLGVEQFQHALATNFDEMLLKGPERVLDKAEKVPPGQGNKLGGRKMPGAGEGTGLGAQINKALPQGVKDWAAGVNSSKQMQAPGQDATGEAQLQPSGSTNPPAAGYGGANTPEAMPGSPNAPATLQGGAREGATPVQTQQSQRTPDFQGGANAGATPVKTQQVSPQMQGIPYTPPQQQPRPPGTYPLPQSETSRPPPYGPAQNATVKYKGEKNAVTGMVAGHGGQDREYQMTPRGVAPPPQKPGLASAIPPTFDEYRSKAPTPTGDDRPGEIPNRGPRIIRAGQVTQYAPQEERSGPKGRTYGELNDTEKQLYDVLGPRTAANARQWDAHLNERATNLMGGKNDPAGTRAQSDRVNNAERETRQRQKEPSDEDKGLTLAQIRAKVFDEHGLDARTGQPKGGAKSTSDGDQAEGKPSEGDEKKGKLFGKEVVLIFSEKQGWRLKEKK
jgi:hypothetical protein